MASFPQSRPVFAALHPILLWGVTAVAVPILIHLLLKQRPRPRPWAAMRWLLAAAREAQRRYRLTNLLLLLLRCLLVLLVALAIARPSLVGIGSGDRLVLVIDRTASMGPRAGDPGPLAEAKAALARVALSYRSVAVLTVADTCEALADGSPADALAAIARIEVSELPGGLDRAADKAEANKLASQLGSAGDVLLISDFQQDAGEQVMALVKPHARSIARWRVGKPGANALVTGIDRISDLMPGQPGEIVVRLSGLPTGATVASDDGLPLPVSGAVSADAADMNSGINNNSGTANNNTGHLRVLTPPLTAGEHHLAIHLEDEGLAYDNALNLLVRVRAQVDVLAVSESRDFLVAALRANDGVLRTVDIRPAALGGQPPPPHGLVALRAPVADGVRLRTWVREGGVLWANLALLNEDAALKELVAGITLSGRQIAGGIYATGDKELDEALSLGSRATAPEATLPTDAELLLTAGKAPLVVAVPAGRGWVIVELAILSSSADQSLQARGTTPLWITRIARQYTGRLEQPHVWQAGLPALVDATLKRGSTAISVTHGDPLLVPPGSYTVDIAGQTSALVVLPNQDEGTLTHAAPSGTVTSIDQALPKHAGSDIGFIIAILALLTALGEGLFASWAGRMYGK